MMFGIFTSIFGREFIIASIILIFGEVISVIMFKIFSVSDLKEFFDEGGFKKEQDQLELNKFTKFRSMKKRKSLLHIYDDLH